MQTFSILIAVVLIFGTAYSIVGNAAAQDSETFLITPSFQDLQEEEIQQTEPGRPVMLHFDVHNNRADTRSGIVVFEVRDSDGFTVYIGWQTITVRPNGDYTMTAYWIPYSWTPSESGEYVIRTFALRGLEGENVGSLSSIFESKRLFVSE